MTPVEQITSLYIGYFGRAPDPEGLNYWVGRLQDGFSLSEIAESFSVQAESQAKYPYLSNPNIASPQAFITQVYMNLFNRMPDAEGLAYWTNELNNGGDVGDFILNVISGAVTDPDQQIVENKIEVGVDFALRAANEPGFVYNDSAASAAVEVINGVDETEASVEAGKAESEDFFENGNVPGGGPDGDTFTLTADTNVQTGGVDIVEGSSNNDNIRAITADSLDSSDIIDGGAGQDVLNISAGAIAAGAAPIISNVETINNAGGDFDLGGVTGANRVNSSASANYTNASFGTTFAATATGLTIGVAYAGSVAGAGTTVDLATDIDNAAGTVTFNVGANAAAAAGVENVNLNVSGDADDVTTVTLDADLVDLTTLTITGEGDVVVASSFAGAADLATINASAATGDVDLALDATAGVDNTAGVSITTGSGNDEVELAGQDDADVSLGAGNDVLNIGGVEQGLTVTLGAGTDAVVFAAAPANIADADEGDFAADVISITDFNGSQDFLDLGGVNVITLTNLQQGTIGSSAGDDLYDAVTDADAFTGGAGDAVVFEFGGSTYIYVDNGAAGFDAGDGLVELTGFTGDLTAANFVA